MKKIAIILLMAIFSNTAFADCDWSKGITPGPNKTFVYTEACHLAVGQLVEDSKTKDQQIVDLTSAIALKNAALLTSDQRTEIWMKTVNDDQNRLNSLQTEQKHTDIIYFVLGVTTTFLAGYMASQLIHK